MKRYFIIGGIVAAGLIITAVALLSSPEDKKDETKSTDTTSTQPTETTKKTTKDRRETTDDEQNDKGTARYVTYNKKTFDENSDKQRVLVFIDESDATSVALDGLLNSSRAELPNDVILYKTLMNKNKEVATLLGVTQPGVAIKFDSDGNLAGIYVAPESPDLTLFQTSLQLNEQAPATTETD